MAALNHMSFQLIFQFQVVTFKALNHFPANIEFWTCDDCQHSRLTSDKFYSHGHFPQRKHKWDFFPYQWCINDRLFYYSLMFISCNFSNPTVYLLFFFSFIFVCKTSTNSMKWYHNANYFNPIFSLLFSFY